MQRLLDLLRGILQGIAVLLIVAILLALTDPDDLNPELFAEDDDGPETGN